MTEPSGAVILAGGRARRLGGTDKPALRLGSRSLLDIALAAAGGGRIVVVGPRRDLPAGVSGVLEDPPGGGPAAAVVAGVGALAGLPDDALVAVLAADLPGITHRTVSGLCGVLSTAALSTAALSGAAPSDAALPDAELLSPAPAGGDVRPGGAVLVDDAGRRQYLIGVWRRSALTSAIGARRDWSGVALRELLAPIAVLEVPGSAAETADVDTQDDWQSWQQRDWSAD